MGQLPRPAVSDGPVRILFDALHELHHRAGWPSLREMAGGLGCSHTTVSAAFSAPRVPRWGLLELIVELLGGDTARFRQLWLAATSPTVDGGRAAPDRTATAVPPRQLPPDMSAFTGRTYQLVELDRLADQRGTAPVTCVLSGTAGVGKTALAVHWAHRAADRFPDGQLYLNLRGFDPGGPPVTTGEAVRGFLEALDVAPERIPGSMQAQIGLYRSLLADRRVLLVLDNARDAGQVWPLLPGAAGCLVLVTTRQDLAGLVAAGAHSLPVDLPSAAEAREMLARRLGTGRACAQPQAVEEIVAACARLPLALAIVAARAAARPAFGLGVLARDLSTARGGLDAFAGADPTADARAVFSWSARQLSSAAAKLFRLLGLHCGPDISAAAAASLCGWPPPRVGPLLAELTRAHLIDEHLPGRYTFHDLLRAYATELALAVDPEPRRRAAVHRVLDHYLHTAHAADRLLRSERDPISLAPARPGVTPQRLADQASSLAWFTAEHAVLLAAVDQAAGAGLDTHAWQLAWTLADFLDRRGHWHDYVATQHTALAAASRVAAPSLQARAHRLLGRAYIQLDRLDKAHTHLVRALVMFRDGDDLCGQARTHHNLSHALERQGRHADALGHARRALDLFRADGHQPGQAAALNTVGWLLAQLGDQATAVRYCRHALRLNQELGNLRLAAITWDSLGFAHHHLGEHARAVRCYQHALDRFRELGDRREEAVTLMYLGDVHHAVGQDAAAGDALRQALRILDSLRHRDAEQVRARLSSLAATTRECPPVG
jgi:tetratricopeptide (TPR) repeat protein